MAAPGVTIRGETLRLIVKPLIGLTGMSFTDSPAARELAVGTRAAPARAGTNEVVVANKPARARAETARDATRG
jgi:hypothetical protein